MADKLRLDQLPEDEQSARDPLSGRNGEQGMLTGEMCAACGWPWLWHSGHVCIHGSKKPDFKSTGRVCWNENGALRCEWISPAHEARDIARRETPVIEEALLLMGTVAAL